MLLATGSLLAINVSLYKNLGYDPEKDFEPITVIGTQTNVCSTPILRCRRNRWAS